MYLSVKFEIYAFFFTVNSQILNFITTGKHVKTIFELFYVLFKNQQIEICANISLWNHTSWKIKEPKT